MKISLAWLKRYLDLDHSPEVLEAQLNQLGFEVEGVVSTGLAPLDKVVVGEVLSKEPHPNANRLNICQVKTVEEGEPHRIVCGATNYKVGDRVPVALPGARLPGDFKIKRSKIRGEASEGMMCSAEELGISEESDGLLILAGDVGLGLPIHEVFKDAQDWVFDLTVTANRPDCLSHIGVARELAAAFGLTLRLPEVKRLSTSEGNEPQNNLNELLEGLEVKADKACPYYRAYAIRGVKVAPSPEWLQRLLKTIGLRPINNVVDITNFVLHEYGQPLHAFDAGKIEGKQLFVRHAAEGESILTLDGQEKKLSPSMLIIADRKQPLVIAGIIGSVDAEVDEGSVDLILESAWFDPKSIRPTSRSLGLSSDSSYRFERGVDPEGVALAAERAVALILEIAGGECLTPAWVKGKPPIALSEILLKPDFVRERLGFFVEDAAIQSALVSLGLKVEKVSGDEEWKVTTPSYRQDLKSPIDLVEEFLRLHGTDKIPAADVQVKGLHREDSATTCFCRQAAQLLKSQYFNECVHLTMREGQSLNEWFVSEQGSAIEVSNPLANDQSHLRTSLLPGLLDALKLNRDRQNQPLQLFEIGRIFKKFKDGTAYDLLSVAFVMVQTPSPAHWDEAKLPDFYDARKRASSLLDLAGVKHELSDWQDCTKEAAWQAGHSAMMGKLKDGFTARVGLMDLDLLKAWDIDGMVLAGEVVLLPDFFDKESSRKRYEVLSPYPPTFKDLALIVDESIPAAKVQEDLLNSASARAKEKFSVESVKLFDVYQGDSLPDGKKSLAFSLAFRSMKGTLTDKVVNKVFSAIQKDIASSTDYTIRDQ